MHAARWFVPKRGLLPANGQLQLVTMASTYDAPVCHRQDDRSKINIIEDVLNRTASFAGVDYVLWMEQNALVVNPAVVFPYKRYSGKDIVMYGELDEVLDGNAACALQHRLLSCCLLRVRRSL